MSSVPIYIRHIVGRCPVDGEPILDSGYDDDPSHWEHAYPDIEAITASALAGRIEIDER